MIVYAEAISCINDDEDHHLLDGKGHNRLKFSLKEHSFLQTDKALERLLGWLMAYLDPASNPRSKPQRLCATNCKSSTPASNIQNHFWHFL